MKKDTLILDRKVLVICGPTATGKTSLALYLAELFNGEIVSADSRQVYKGMDVGTGKDLPKNSKWHQLHKTTGFWETVKGIRIWGYDLVSPKKNFSVSKYVKITNKVVDDISQRGKLPIVAGGTGLYLKGLIEGIETLNVRRNLWLRKLLKDKSWEELYEELATLDPLRAGSLNASDKRNPRRLIRAIEVAQWKIKKGQKVEVFKAKNFDILFIGLSCKPDILRERIDKRVEERLKNGLLEEIKKLTGDAGVGWNLQSMEGLGYRQWKEYFEGKKSKNEIIAAWKIDEKNYAKRQMTWFKKDERIRWFDVSKLGYKKSIERLVEKWHNMDISNSQNNN